MFVSRHSRKDALSLSKSGIVCCLSLQDLSSFLPAGSSLSIHDCNWNKAPGFNEFHGGTQCMLMELEVVREVEENQHLLWVVKHKRPDGWGICTGIMSEFHIHQGLFVPLGTYCKVFMQSRKKCPFIELAYHLSEKEGKKVLCTCRE